MYTVCVWVGGGGVSQEPDGVESLALCGAARCDRRWHSVQEKSKAVACRAFSIYSNWEDSLEP